MAFTLIAKAATWPRLLLIKVGLLNQDGKYTKIKIIQSTETEQIKTNITEHKKKIPSLQFLTSIAALKIEISSFISFSLKSNNYKESMALVHNSVFYIQTKHINI